MGAEMLAEGLPQRSLLTMVLAVYTGLMTTGVLLGYLLLNRTLGIFRKDPVAP